MAVSAFASNADKAVSAVPLVLLPQILLAGVIFPLSGPAVAIGSLTVSRWAVQALGTSADLNHLYYTEVAANAKLPGGQVSIPNYDPTDYDSNPQSRNYSVGVAPAVSWADAEESRRQHIVLLWTIEGLCFITFVGVAAARQKAKDPH